MAINKTLVLTWNDVDYDIHMTMRLIDRIEEDINLMKMVERASTGDVRFAHAANLISILLKSAGCLATQEEVFEGMFGGDEEMQPHEVVALLWKVFAVIFPDPKKKPTAAKKPKRLKSTRGKTSTK